MHVVLNEVGYYLNARGAKMTYHLSSMQNIYFYPLMKIGL